MAGFDEKKFEREEDARTLMRAVEVQKDSKRLAAAKKELVHMEQHAKEEALDRKIAKKLKKL